MQERKEILLKALEKYENSKEYEHYREQEEVIVSLFEEHSKNDDLNSVLLKVCVLDGFYSTNLRMQGINDMAKHILKLNIDNALKQGDPSIVEKIANFANSKGEKVFLYSFASKYCFHHNNDKYVIFDKFAMDTLLDFQKENKFCSFKFSQNSLKNYEFLLKVIDELKAFYALDKFNNRQIDHMLWVRGKDEDEKKKKEKK